MSIKLNFPKLMTWQSDVMNTQAQYYNQGKNFVIKSSRQKGKSFLICCLALVRALYKPNQTVIIVSPTNNQNGRIFKILRNSIIETPIMKSANAGSLIITLHNKSEIVFKSAEQRDALRGYTATTALIVDEAAFIPEEIYEIILPFKTKHKAEMFLFSTPLFKEGTFYRMYNDGLSNNDTIFTFDWSDTEKYDFTEFITDEQIEEFRKMYAPMKFSTEILGQFVSDKSFVFGNILSCVKDIEDIEDKIPMYVGIDFATGIGNDSTVMTTMNSNGDVLDIWAVNNMPTNEQIERLADMLNDMPTVRVCLVEMNSIGKVFYDGLLSKLNNKSILKGFATTNSSKRRIVEKVITAFQNQRISIPNNPELHKQLSSFEVKKTAQGYTYGNARDNIHDDYVISLCLAFDAKSSINAGSFGFAS